jgi:hypothetical protein
MIDLELSFVESKWNNLLKRIKKKELLSWKDN